jgi:hypothetical protein
VLLCPSFQEPPLNRPEWDILVHAKADFVTTRRARVTRRYEAPDDVRESTIIDLLGDPVLIEEAADMHAPRIASRDRRWSHRYFGCPATWRKRY